MFISVTQRHSLGNGKLNRGWDTKEFRVNKCKIYKGLQGCEVLRSQNITMDLAEFLLNYKAIMLVIAYHKFGNWDSMEKLPKRHKLP